MKNDAFRRIEVIDSHTAGEPTRVVIKGGPDLGGGSAADQLRVFEGKHDRFRCAIVNEPRGSDVMVGAILTTPADSTCAAGVIFFNNVGYLGMCGHGMIGVVTTLAFLGRMEPGIHRIETPVGVISATLAADGDVVIANVASFRKASGVRVDVPGIGLVRGDIAWAGNWFFLIAEHGQQLSLANVESLTDYAWRVRQAVNAQGFPEVDHIEMFGPPSGADANAKNFVLCPGKAYDRSPCGTGTSAKAACLAADGKLAVGQTWIQEGILGTRFTAQYAREGDRIFPRIGGRAYVTGQTILILDERDPFQWGIPAAK